MAAAASLFSASVAALIVYSRFADVGNAGYVLSQILKFSMLVFAFIRQANAAEVESMLHLLALCAP
jgi:hypothetical protein